MKILCMCTFKLSSEQQFISTSLFHGPVTVSWFSPIIIIINFNISLLQLPTGKNNHALILGCHTAFFWLDPLAT
jgi:hypothetical protein